MFEFEWIVMLAHIHRLPQFYRCTSRELTRLTSISNSPIFANLTETLSGVSTLRAFGAGARFSAKNLELLTANVRVYWVSILANRWLALHLQVVGNMVMVSVAACAVALRHYLDPNLLGLALTYALTVTGSLNWMVRSLVGLESVMTSVERLRYYAEDIPQEAAGTLPSDPSPRRWPTEVCGYSPF